MPINQVSCSRASDGGEWPAEALAGKLDPQSIVLHYTAWLTLTWHVQLAITIDLLFLVGKPVLEEAGGESKGKNATEAPLSPGSWTGNQVLRLA